MGDGASGALRVGELGQVIYVGINDVNDSTCQIKDFCQARINNNLPLLPF